MKDFKAIDIKTFAKDFCKEKINDEIILELYDN